MKKKLITVSIYLLLAAIYVLIFIWITSPLRVEAKSYNEDSSEAINTASKDLFGFGDLSGDIERAEDAIERIEKAADSLEKSAGSIEKNANKTQVTLPKESDIDYDKLVRSVTCPQNLYLRPLISDGNCFGLTYGISYTDDIVSIMKAKDQYTYLYQVTCEVEYSLNGKAARTYYGTDYDFMLTNIPCMGLSGELFYVYSDGTESDIEIMDYLSDSLKEVRADIWPTYAIDLSSNEFTARARYLITDQKTGGIYYSDWSDLAKVGKDNPFDYVPNVLPDVYMTGDAEVRYASYGNYADSVLFIPTLSSSENDKIAYANYGTMFVCCEAQIEGKYECIYRLPYEYTRYDGVIDVYLGEFEELKLINGQNFRVRYEWYLSSDDVGISDPNLSGSYTSFTIQ